MDESQQTRRVLLASALMMLVLFGWMYLFPTPPPKRPPPSTGELATGTSSVAGVATATATAASPTPVPTSAVPVERATFAGRVRVATDGTEAPYTLELTNVGGAIERFELSSYRERDADNRPTEEPIRLAVPKDGRPSGAVLRFGEGTTFAWSEGATFEVVEKTATSVRYRAVSQDGITIEREYAIDPGSFEIEMAVTVRNGSRSPQRHRLALDTTLPLSTAAASGGGFLLPPADHLNVACHTDGSVVRGDHRKLLGESQRHRESVKWVGVERQYFVAATIPRDGVAAECQMSAKDNLATGSLVLPEVALEPGEQRRHKFTLYFGVKKPELLSHVDAELESAVDYNVLGLNLAILCEALLAILGLIHRLTGSWGLAILGLTVLVKAVLFPLNQRSGKSMRAMTAIKPEIDKLREKYPNPEDRTRQTEELMRLYREHGVNPASGCVPILLQMPIWFALYRALWVSVDLYQQPFLWLPDLTARDPYWILPVVLTIVMVVQQRLTPTAMDPVQQKIMYVMPLLFGAMMVAVPAGLNFYIVVNSLLTIAQQHFINKSIGPLTPAPSGQRAATT